MKYTTERIYAAVLAIVLLALGGCSRPTVAQPAPTAEEPPHTQRVDGATLDRAGTIRLSDVFSLLDDWQTYSTDGYTWHAAPNALGPMQQAGWLLLVDGLPVDVTALGVQNVNVLPLDAADLDRVDATNAPSLQAGRFATRGTLHLHTERPKDGLQVRAGGAAGNPTGDPGPFRYTRSATPNVDRTGPHASASVAYGTGTWYARLAAKTDEHHATNPQLKRRINEYYRPRPRLHHTSVSLIAGVDGSRGRHTLLAGATRFQDFRFFEPAGLEIPTDQRLYLTGLAGDAAVHGTTRVHYHLGLTVSDLDPRANRRGAYFDWRQDRATGSLELHLGGAPVSGRVGASADLYRSATGYPLTDAELVRARLYGSFVLAPDTRWRQKVTAVLSRVEASTGIAGRSTTHVRPHPDHRVTLSLSLDRRPFAATNSPWLWVDRGLGFDALTFHKVEHIPIALPSSFAPSTTATADLTWSTTPIESLTFTLSGAYRRFDETTVPAYRMGYNEQTDGFDAQTIVRTNVYGRVVRGAVTAALQGPVALTQRLHYAYTRTPTRDPAFWAAWQPTPWHRLDYTAVWTPISRFSLFARLRYQSSTQWPAYRSASLATAGRYPTTLSSRWLLDVALQKHLWKEHLQVHLSFRNALNQPVRYHPGGASFPLAVFAQITARL